MNHRRLSDTPAFRGLREELFARDGSRQPVCDRCGQEVNVQDWHLHRTHCPDTRLPEEKFQ